MIPRFFGYAIRERPRVLKRGQARASLSLLPGCVRNIAAAETRQRGKLSLVGRAVYSFSGPAMLIEERIGLALIFRYAVAQMVSVPNYCVGFCWTTCGELYCRRVGEALQRVALLFPLKIREIDAS